MAPQWLTESLFEDILKTEYDRYKIVKFTTQSAVPEGENYASVLSRVSIEVQLPDESTIPKQYIVKSGQESSFSGYTNEFLYPKEQEIYNELIPQFEKLFTDIGDPVKFAPICYTTINETKTLILEDLQQHKFRNAQRHVGMNLMEAETTLVLLARFHAASACFFELHGSYSDQFNQGLYQEEMVPVYETMFTQLWPLLYDSMKNWTDCTKFVDKLQAKKAFMVTRLMNSLACNPSEFNVLNHGDFWCNNIMFQYNNDGGIDQTIFIDFQLCKWGSPVQDLQHFIITSCCPEIRVKKFDHLISHYHSNLVKYLKLLHYKGNVPELDDLNQQLKKRGQYGLNTSLSILPAVLMDPNEKAGIKQRLKIYSNQKYVEAMKELLPFFDKQGILDT